MAYLGMRGTGDWSDTKLLDEEYRATLLLLEPNGDMPLTGITAMIGGETTHTKTVNWITDKYVIPMGAITGIYTDSGLTTAYTGGASAGTTLYLKCSETTAGYFRTRIHANLTKADDYSVFANVEVTAAPVINGSSSYLTVKTLAADSSSTDSIANATWIKSIGDINEEGADYPNGISYEPVPLENVTGIIRTPVEITRTQWVSKNLRTNTQAYDYIVQKGLLDHGRDIEMKLLYSKLDKTSTGTNGKPKWAPMGLFEFIDTYASGNVFNYLTDTDYTGATWVEAGDQYLKKALNQIFKWGKMEKKLAIVGRDVLAAITDLAEVNSQYVIDWQDRDYGLKVATFHSPYGSIDMKTHPLLSWTDADSHSMIIVEPENIIPRPFAEADAVFYEDDRKNHKFSHGADAVKEEWLTEITWEFHHAEVFGRINGVGKDNPL